MNLRFALLVPSLAIAVTAGCYTGSAVDTNRAPAVIDSDPNEPVASAEDGGRVRGVSAPTGLPCDVAEILNECSDCHGSPLAGGAPNRLLSHADFTKGTEDDPSVTMARLSLARMKSASRPMPPSGKLRDAQIAVFEKWVDDGMPRGTCGEPSPEPDAGPAPIDAGPTPPPTLTCTSGKTVPPDVFGPTMRPGSSCLSCHTGASAPAFEIAGTVYPTLHEPNGCQGTTGVKVLIIDAAGMPHTLSVNEAGNFSRVTSFPRPYRALVVRGNEIREMKTPQTDGNCNRCHSANGNGAPGRVVAP